MNKLSAFLLLAILSISSFVYAMDSGEDRTTLAKTPVTLPKDMVDSLQPFAPTTMASKEWDLIISYTSPHTTKFRCAALVTHARILLPKGISSERFVKIVTDALSRSSDEIAARATAIASLPLPKETTPEERGQLGQTALSCYGNAASIKAIVDQAVTLLPKGISSGLFVNIVGDAQWSTPDQINRLAYTLRNAGVLFPKELTVEQQGKIIRATLTSSKKPANVRAVVDHAATFFPEGISSDLFVEIAKEALYIQPEDVGGYAAALKAFPFLETINPEQRGEIIKLVLEAPRSTNIKVVNKHATSFFPKGMSSALFVEIAKRAVSISPEKVSEFAGALAKAHFHKTLSTPEWEAFLLKALEKIVPQKEKTLEDFYHAIIPPEETAKPSIIKERAA